MMSYLVSLEILFEMVVRDYLAWDTIEGKMLSNGVDMPSVFERIELCSITKLDIFNMRREINIACDDWLIIWEHILPVAGNLSLFILEPAPIVSADQVIMAKSSHEPMI